MILEKAILELKMGSLKEQKAYHLYIWQNGLCLDFTPLINLYN